MRFQGLTFFIAIASVSLVATFEQASAQDGTTNPPSYEAAAAAMAAAMGPQEPVKITSPAVGAPSLGQTVDLDKELADLLASPTAAVPPGQGLPPSWRAMIDRRLEVSLKDPQSAIKKVTAAPRFGRVKPDVWTTWSGWVVCYQVNAKNSYGGYTGLKPYLFVVNGDGVVGDLSGGRDSLWTDGIIARECPAT